MITFAIFNLCRVLAVNNDYKIVFYFFVSRLPTTSTYYQELNPTPLISMKLPRNICHMFILVYQQTNEKLQMILSNFLFKKNSMYWGSSLADTPAIEVPRINR